ncbi:MAG: membrane dipeptidase [Rhodobacteraceae bacterium]|nr:membrane dipeptidase [Paracoccaceae bacterium]
MQPVFDGHNDTLLRLWRAGDLEGRRFLDGDGEGHIDLPRARTGGLAGGFFAVYVPARTRGQAVAEADDGCVVDHPQLGPVDGSDARRIAFEMAAILLRMTEARPECIRLCRSGAEIEAANAAGAMAAILHLEGAEAIGPDLGELEVLYAAGLRSLGPVWSRPNIFGTGVPFRFPGDPDEGPGLTEAGKALVRACDRLGVLVDLSHLNAAGFRDVAAISERPLVATHSNARALAASSRNLTDWQLAAIAESGGVVGLNFAVGFLRDDGRRVSDTPLTTMIRHIDYLLERLGEAGVALGSDFDGALIPREIGDAAGLPALVGAMRQAGYGADLVDRICRRNWLTVLSGT